MLIRIDVNGIKKYFLCLKGEIISYYWVYKIRLIYFVKTISDWYDYFKHFIFLYLCSIIIINSYWLISIELLSYLCQI